MRRLKVPLTMLLALFVAADLIVACKLWQSGWPKRIGLTAVQKGIEEVQVMRGPFTGSDWFILVLVIAVHAFLCFLVWRVWRSTPVRV